ncbi:MAG: leucine-rich repeat domain-containing protein, partial [Bacteroidales bacterium]
MKKFLLSFILFFFLVNIGYSQVIQFEDSKFKYSLINDQDPSVDLNGNGQIEVSEAAIYSEEINVSNKGLTSVKEICYFKALRSFHCANNQLKTLDLRQNTDLYILYCPNNQLTNIQFAYTKNYSSIICSNNKITNLDVPNTSVLKCSNNTLISLNLSKCTNLQKLQITNTQLSSLDISFATDLREVNVSNNKLTTLKLGSGTKMASFNCANNKLTSLEASNLRGFLFQTFNCSNNKLKTLSISSNPRDVQCDNNEITQINFPAGNLRYRGFNCANNMLSIGVLWRIKKNANELSNFNYSNQRPIARSASHETEIVFTCDEDILMNGKPTVFRWFKNNLPASSSDVETVSNGKYIFHTPGNYYYNCTNTVFPGITSKVFLTVVENTRKNQIITIGAIPDYIELNKKVTFNASTNAPNLKVSYQVSPNTCIINANEITFKTLGEYTVILSQAGNSEYNAAPNKVFTVIVSKKRQHIRLERYPEEFFINTHYYFKSISTAGLPVSCTVDPSEGVTHYTSGGYQQHITFPKAGNYTLRLNQAGNEEFASASELVLNVYVKKKSLEVTIFSSSILDEDGVVGAKYNFHPLINPVNPDSDAPKDVNLSVTPKTYEYDPGNYKIKFNAPGTYTVRVYNDGNDYYYPVERNFTINVTRKKQVLSIYYMSRDIKVDKNAIFRIRNTSSLPVDVKFSPDTYTCLNSERYVFKKAGNYQLILNQAGNDKYKPAEEVKYDFTVGKGNQTISFSSSENPRNAYVNDSKTFKAKVSSDLKPIYTVEPNTCTINNDVVTFHKEGNYVISAQHPGDDNYLASNVACWNIMISKKVQNISLGEIPQNIKVLTPTIFNASTNAKDLKVSYEIASDVAEIKENEITFKKGGPCKVMVNCAGNDEYKDAVMQYFFVDVIKKAQKITVSQVPKVVSVNDEIPISFSTDAEGLDVSCSVNIPTYSLEDGILKLTASGNYKITLSQKGNDIYKKATSVCLDIRANRRSQELNIGNLPEEALVNKPIKFNISTADKTLKPIYRINPNTYTENNDGFIFNQVTKYNIRVQQSGSNEYKPAEDYVFELNVVEELTKENQTITIGNIPSQVKVDIPVEFNATTDAEGLQVDYSVEPNTCSINGNQITFLEGGDYTIK